MNEPIVTDSTCLIGLERIDHLDLLPSLFEPILIPPEVNSEFAITLPWLQVEAPSDAALIVALGILLDRGEAEAIALASERGYRVILDDLRARSIARKLGLRILGTVGVLVQARRRGIISLLKPVLDDLEASGFYLSKALKEEALHLVGE